MSLFIEKIKRKKMEKFIRVCKGLFTDKAKGYKIDVRSVNPGKNDFL